MIRFCCAFFLTLSSANALRLQGTFSDGNEPCSNMAGIVKEFCLQTLGTRKKAHMLEYKSWRAECSWTKKTAEWTSLTVVHSLSTDGRFFAINPDPNAKESSTVTLWTCFRDLGQDGQLHIFKVGPYLTQGNASRWQRFQIDNIFPHYNGKERGVTGYLQVPVDVSGEILGRPPIHIHHNHLADAQCDFFGVVGRRLDAWSTREAVRGFHVWADTHGDKQCLRSMGGVNCLFRRFPNGWAIPMTLRKGGCFFADYVDERSAGAQELKWWVENAVLIHPPRQLFHRIGCYYMGVGGGDGFGGEYTVDTRNESITWGTQHFMHDGRVVQVLKHTHQAASDDGWLIRGDAQSLGLPEMRLLDHQNLDTQRNVAPHLSTIKKQLRRRIDDLSQRGLAELLCTYSSQGNTLEQVDGVLYDRLTPVPCAGWEFRANEKYVFISFHKLSEQFKEAFVKQSKMGMHSTFYLFTQPKDSNSTEDVILKGDGPVEEQRPRMIQALGQHLPDGWIDQEI